MFGALWSEHCGYKNTQAAAAPASRPTGAHVLTKRGAENAGAVDIGDGCASSFKIESHNHPSAIEPYEGAATGVGGIVRDIFAMGARPIALLDSLRFGPLDATPHNRYLFGGVVAGIGGYGNCLGIPTVGGEVYVRRRLRRQPAGERHVRRRRRASDQLVSARARRRRQPADAGRRRHRPRRHPRRDVRLASSSTRRSEELRPAVQVGNPFLEKLLMEACVELAEQHARLDRRAAGPRRGRAHSVRGRVAAPRAAPASTSTSRRCRAARRGMTPYEVMLSESQERMLVIAEARARGRRAARSSSAGSCTPTSSATSPTTAWCASATATTRSRACPSTCSPTPPQYTPRRRAARRARRAAGATTSARCRTSTPADADGGAAATCSRSPEHRVASAGSAASTTTRCSPTPSCRPAATRRSCGSRARRKGIAVATDGNGRVLLPRPATRAARSPSPRPRATSSAPARSPIAHHRLPQLRQPGAAGGLLPAQAGDPRHGRRLRGARHARHLRQRLASTTRPTARRSSRRRSSACSA